MKYMSYAAEIYQRHPDTDRLSEGRRAAALERMVEEACREVDRLRAQLAEARKDGERLNQLWSDTTAELLTCRTALSMLKRDIEPMAAQIIHPKDNVMSRMVAIIDNALQATYAASRAVSEPPAALSASREQQGKGAA
jgi:chromosome segregation ATPase